MRIIIHRIAVCSLIILMSFKLLGGFSYNLYFWWNQKQLSKAHCVNQNKPKMHCNGKCYLAKQLAKIENDFQKKQRQPAPFQLKSNEWIFDLDSAITAFNLQTSCSIESKRLMFIFSEHFSSPYIKTPTPPPDFV